MNRLILTKAALAVLLISILCGCQRSMNGPRLGQRWGADGTQNGLGPRFAWGRGPENGVGPADYEAQAQRIAKLSSQIDDLSGQLGKFDTDNEGLHAENAELKRRLQVSNDFNVGLKTQLRETMGQLTHLQQSSQQLEQRLAAQQASATNTAPTRLAGSATLRANNSLMGKLQLVQAAGAKAWMDGDVIRVELPSQELFVPGTYQVSATKAPALRSLASTIRQHFPNQFVGVEAHWDNSRIEGVNSQHQLTATQAIAVFNHLVQAGIPARQMFTSGMGSNRPRYRDAATQNRRVEIVIYPESFDQY